ncbi:P pilus assembly chaperone PapD [Paenibacillus sp. JGP012]|uniref:hypothetical protein n=1 Tax=Paenibacillus sp. JGP012 TaxID=2735914 RepID=UPI00161289CC|nr:hypothetical protein [Paenibacillus sp. JGP012]MBB6020949.1 P pilus assembly chaperone PapD [Paenibacillus sp. JGP012]
MWLKKGLLSAFASLMILGISQPAMAAEMEPARDYGGGTHTKLSDFLPVALQSQLVMWVFHNNLSPTDGLQTTYNYARVTINAPTSFYIDITQTSVDGSSIPNVTYVVFKENGSNNVGWNVSGNGYHRRYFIQEAGTYFLGYYNNGPGNVSISANVFVE